MDTGSYSAFEDGKMLEGSFLPFMSVRLRLRAKIEHRLTAWSAKKLPSRQINPGPTSLEHLHDWQGDFTGQRPVLDLDAVGVGTHQRHEMYPRPDHHGLPEV